MIELTSGTYPILVNLDHVLFIRSMDPGGAFIIGEERKAVTQVGIAGGTTFYVNETVEEIQSKLL